jgi:hypothetical protein
MKKTIQKIIVIFVCFIAEDSFCNSGDPLQYLYKYSTFQIIHDYDQFEWVNIEHSINENKFFISHNKIKTFKIESEKANYKYDFNSYKYDFDKEGKVIFCTESDEDGIHLKKYIYNKDTLKSIILNDTVSVIFYYNSLGKLFKNIMFSKASDTLVKYQYKYDSMGRIIVVQWDNFTYKNSNTMNYIYKDTLLWVYQDTLLMGKYTFNKNNQIIVTSAGSHINSYNFYTYNNDSYVYTNDIDTIVNIPYYMTFYHYKNNALNESYFKMNDGSWGTRYETFFKYKINKKGLITEQDGEFLGFTNDKHILKNKFHYSKYW